MKSILLYAAFLLITGTTRAQCISTGFKSGSLFTTDNSIGVYNFSSPGNSQTSDNARASAASVIAILSGNTYYLKATGFNFNIPAYAMICGITIEVECRANGLLFTAAVRDNDVRLIKNGVIAGDNKAIAGDWETGDTYRTYGDGTNLWGTSLAPGDVNSSDFGVAFSARIIALIGALPSAEIDHIRIKIDYNLVLPVHLLYFSALPRKNSVGLQWETAEEEDGGSIILQRSYLQTQWEDIKRFELHTSNHSQVYHYTDNAMPGERYSYRLKIISASGVITYSMVRIVIIERNTITVYPNPSRDVIFLSSIQAGRLIAVIDNYGRQWSIAAEKTAADQYKLNIHHLPRGMYSIQCGGQTVRFMKE